MKINRIKILIGTVCILVILLIGTNIALGSATSANDKVKLNNPYYTGKHDTNIEPDYKANKEKDTIALLSKSEILSIVEKNQVKSETSSIKSVKLKTYKEHILEDDVSDYNYNYMVDEDRMVWVIITEFPDGINTKAAYYDNATLITVLDAETGDYIKSKVRGDVKIQYKNSKIN